jgi:hypothetical protein
MRIRYTETTGRIEAWGPGSGESTRNFITIPDADLPADFAEAAGKGKYIIAGGALVAAEEGSN